MNGLNDENIKEAVKDAFVYDPRLYSFNVEVDVQDGAVTLSGVVKNIQAKRAAQQDARNVFGVRRVINNIKVRPENIPSNSVLKSRVADAFVNDRYIQRHSLDISVIDGGVYIEAQRQWQWKPDSEIVEDVESELFWSPFVDRDDIEISVNSGIVTLTGDVDTYSERQSAEENAFEGGARDVINQVTIDGTNDQDYFYGPYYYYGPYTPYGYYYYPMPY